MTTILASALALLLSLASSTSAEPIDTIALYSDPAHTSTIATDNTPGTMTVYVVYETLVGGTGASLRIVPSPGFSGVWLGDTYSFLHLGNSQVGLGLAFPGCILSTQLLQIRYAMTGTSDYCSTLDVVADPTNDVFNGPPFIVDCDFEAYPAIGGRLTINPNASCSPVPVAPTTWGKVKALYR